MSVLADPALTWIARLVLVLVFGWAAIAKLRALEEFVGVVSNYRLLPEALVRPVAWVLPPLELACAIGLLVPATSAPAAAATAGLLLVFAGAMAINIRRGRTQIDCGCFAATLKQHLSPMLVGRNLVLVALGGLAAMPARARPLTWLDSVTIVLAVLGFAALYAAISQLGALGTAAGRRKET